MLSIITINYNNQRGLSNTFQSIFEQTYKDFEFIVIDGGSSDGSKELIEQNEDRITRWISERDTGIYNAMNKGCKYASGEFVLFLNSGDTFFDNNVLANVLPHLTDARDLVFGDMNYVGTTYTWVKHYDSEKIDFDFFVRDTLPHQGTFIRRKLLDMQDGPYDESLKICADWKFFIFAAYKYNARIHHVPVTIANFLFDGLSSKKESKMIILSERLNVLMNDFEPDFLNSFSHLLDMEKSYMDLKKSRIVKYYFNAKKKITGKGLK